MSVLLERLDDEEVSLLILKDGASIYSSRKGGIAPLLDAIAQLGRDRLSNSTVVDKVVGKAAALLIAYFKAERVYSKLMSRAAAEILDRHGVGFFSSKTVDVIRNRAGTDICPFEQLVLRVEEPAEAYTLLKRAASLSS
ncbi:MAG: DUF1893 domain-containing protein [Candidatus Bathyarchaeia archaeon]